MTRGQRDQLDLLRGAPDRFILRTLHFGPRHGHSMAHTIRLTSWAGKRRLTAESSKWGRLTEAIARVMRPREEEG